MDHDTARTILLGLSEGATAKMRSDAIPLVMAERERSVAAPTTREFTVPFPRNRHGSVTFPSPMTDEDWTYLLSVLEAMRPGVVSTPDPNPDPVGPAADGAEGEVEEAGDESP